ncbi:MAG: hydroxyacid dehydrogenase [Candidatus Micrarchaeota archaeon]|nr:hydroxyacid dehydrogenase [Candidatus Micrarchaeota archaeon]
MKGEIKIVVAENMEKEVVAQLEKLGKVSFLPKDIFSEVKDADVLIVRSGIKVDESLLSKAHKLKIVARAGVGLDNIDAEACKRHGIRIINTPAASSNAVAELALGLMLAVSRKIAKADYSMKRKTWIKKELVGTELEGKTLGIVGLGRIGTILAIKAKALGMKVVYSDPKSYSAIGERLNLHDLLAVSDYVSLHLPLTPETRELINPAAIAKMKKTAVLINTARGALVDEEALYQALKEGKIAGAALDVYPEEPYAGKLCELDNVVLTPHIGGSTKEAQLRIGSELVEKLKEELKACFR